MRMCSKPADIDPWPWNGPWVNILRSVWGVVKTSAECLALCDWFWVADKSQMQDWVRNIQAIWASVHSPDSPCKSRLSCWVPDMNNQHGIPIKVDCNGLSEARAQKLWDETRGKVSKRTLKRYASEQFEEMRNRPRS